MKTIGLLGGMSWESTVTYYRLINEFVKERLGGLHSARILLNSLDFHEVQLLQKAGDWHGAGHLLADATRSLEIAGADCVVICTNTMHKVASAVEAAVHIPLLHIADPTAQVIKAAGYSAIGLLGTKITMEQDFYRDRMTTQHGLTVLTPSSADRDEVHRIIFEELCLGKLLPESRTTFCRVISALSAQGAEAVILGCTEISLLISQIHTPVPLFDTTAIHALHAAAWALEPDDPVARVSAAVGLV
jgi:aspartate racemase